MKVHQLQKRDGVFSC